MNESLADQRFRRSNQVKETSTRAFNRKTKKSRKINNTKRERIDREEMGDRNAVSPLD